MRDPKYGNWKGIRVLPLTIFSSAIFFGSFSLLLLRHFLPNQDLFFQTLLSTIIQAVIGVAFLRFLPNYDFGKKGLFIFSICATFFILSQTQVLNVDRSRSFYLLSWVDQGIVQDAGHGISFDRECSIEMTNPEGIRDRLDEQVSRGFVTQSGSEFKLTPIGKVQLFLADKLASLFNLRNWDKNAC